MDTLEHGPLRQYIPIMQPSPARTRTWTLRERLGVEQDGSTRVRSAGQLAEERYPVHRPAGDEEHLEDDYFNQLRSPEMIANDDVEDNDYDLEYDSDVDKVPETTPAAERLLGGADSFQNYMREQRESTTRSSDMLAEIEPRPFETIPTKEMATPIESMRRVHPKLFGLGNQTVAPPADRVQGGGGVEGSHAFSPHHTTQLSQHAFALYYPCMCAMALRLVLVFRPVSPLSEHSHAAGRRGSPTLSPGLDSGRHTSLELQSKKLFSLGNQTGPPQAQSEVKRSTTEKELQLESLARDLLSKLKALEITVSSMEATHEKEVEAIHESYKRVIGMRPPEDKSKSMRAMMDDKVPIKIMKRTSAVQVENSLYNFKGALEQMGLLDVAEGKDDWDRQTMR